MQKSPNVAMLAVVMKHTHHHRGAGCSMTPEIRCVSQLKLRRFNTSGTRAICRSASWTSSAVVDAPSILYGTQACGLCAQRGYSPLPRHKTGNMPLRHTDKMSMFPVMLVSPPSLRCRHLSRQAFSDLDFEDVRDNSFAE